MGETMNFPETIEEFLHQYSFYDTDEVYTNGAELISIYRVLQALEYYYPKVDNK